MTGIVVTGGSGGLGSLVLPQLAEGRVRVVSRRARPDTERVAWVRADLVRGTGVAGAFEGADVVLHLAGGGRGDDVAAARVAEEARRAGVGHLVLVSVVGADAMPIGWFHRKAAAETAVRAAGVPWTILRAAQFHSFAARTLGPLARLPVGVAPRMRLEPVAAEEVARRLAALAAGAPHGRVQDLVGPEVLDATAIVGSLRPRGGPVRALTIPGAAGRAYRDGANLAAPEADRGGSTWADFLRQRA